MVVSLCTRMGGMGAKLLSKAYSYACGLLSCVWWRSVGFMC